MRIEAQSVAEYIAKLPPDRAAIIAHLRRQLHAIAPAIRETLDYGMPTYYYSSDTLVCSFGSQKHYCALYVDPAIVTSYRGQLDGLNCGKSCIRFRRLEELPIMDEILRDAYARATGASSVD